MFTNFVVVLQVVILPLVAVVVAVQETVELVEADIKIVVL